jgi:hypothetical protein
MSRGHSCDVATTKVFRAQKAVTHELHERGELNSGERTVTGAHLNARPISP